jgi:hypothetical protein
MGFGLMKKTVQSPLSTVVGESCSVFHDNRFKVNPSSPREVKKLLGD